MRFVSKYKSCADQACQDPSCLAGPPAPETIGAVADSSERAQQVPEEIDLGRTPILKHNLPQTDDDPDAIQGSVYIPQGKNCVVQAWVGSLPVQITMDSGAARTGGLDYFWLSSGGARRRVAPAEAGWKV